MHSKSKTGFKTVNRFNNHSNRFIEEEVGSPMDFFADNSFGTCKSLVPLFRALIKPIQALQVGQTDRIDK